MHHKIFARANSAVRPPRRQKTIGQDFVLTLDTVNRARRDHQKRHQERRPRSFITSGSVNRESIRSRLLSCSISTNSAADHRVTLHQSSEQLLAAQTVGIGHGRQ